MSKFILVKESRYNEQILLNVDNIAVITLHSRYVLVNGTHGEGTGHYNFDEANFKKILDATGVHIEAEKL